MGYKLCTITISYVITTLINNSTMHMASYYVNCNIAMNFGY